MCENVLIVCQKNERIKFSKIMREKINVPKKLNDVSKSLCDLIVETNRCQAQKLIR